MGQVAIRSYVEQKKVLMLDNCSLGTKIAEIEKITTRANEFRSHEGITLETSAFQIFKC